MLGAEEGRKDPIDEVATFQKSLSQLLTDLFQFFLGGHDLTVPPVESLPFESLRAVSLSNRQVERQNTPWVRVAECSKFLVSQTSKATDLIPWYGVYFKSILYITVANGSTGNNRLLGDVTLA
jgi:hypothetical protein